MVRSLLLSTSTSDKLTRVRSPGRFFAANELKTMMAYIVLNYDVKFAEEGKRPANIRFGLADLPSHTAKVLFRRRRPHGSL